MWTKLRPKKSCFWANIAYTERSILRGCRTKYAGIVYPVGHVAIIACNSQGVAKLKLCVCVVTCLSWDASSRWICTAAVGDSSARRPPQNSASICSSDDTSSTWRSRTVCVSSTSLRSTGGRYGSTLSALSSAPPTTRSSCRQAFISTSATSGRRATWRTGCERWWRTTWTRTLQCWKENANWAARLTTTTNRRYYSRRDCVGIWPRLKARHGLQTLKSAGTHAWCAKRPAVSIAVWLTWSPTNSLCWQWHDDFSTL